MDVTEGLLVAMMFVMILSIGIGNILMAIPPLVDRRVDLSISGLHLSWITLLLLMHLNLFWQVRVILDGEQWGFGGFLCTVAGPILLLLATSVLLPDPAQSDPGTQYRESSRTAFILLALVMAWLPLMDFAFGPGLHGASYWNVVALGLFIGLASTDQQRMHVTGAVVAWALFGSLVLARGLGLVV